MSKSVNTSGKKIVRVTAFVIIAVVFGIAGYKFWDDCLFWLRGGVVDPAESDREEELWRAADNLARDYVAVIYAAKEAVPSVDSGDASKPRKFDLAKLQKISADAAEKFRERKKQLLQMADDADVGYRGDVLMMHALWVKQLELSYTNLELCVNAEANSQRRYDKDVGADFYKRYLSENKERKFKYPDLNERSQEYDRSYAALCNTAYWCMQEHGGYRFYQGGSSSEVRADLTAFAGDSALQDLRGDVNAALDCAKLRCLERRLEQGSFFASFWYPLKKKAAETSMRSQLEDAEQKNHDFLAEPMRLNRFAAARSREDKLWNAANYLTWCAEDFLWTAKFGVKHNAGADKLLKWRMRPQYEKNGAEMKFYVNAFNADLQLSRQKISAEGASDVCALQKKSLELCSAADDILAVWDNYRQGRIDYDAFCRELLNKENAFEKKRSEVIKERWDYLCASSQGSRGYAVSSLVFDGVPAAVIKPLAEQKK